MKSPFSWSPFKKKKGPTLAEQNRAATKVQAVTRGRNVRKGLMGQIGDTLYDLSTAPVRFVANAVAGAGQTIAAAVKASHVTDAQVEAPTPDDRWFKPTAGWTATDSKGFSPSCLMPTARHAEALFPTESEVIGELRVEVLEMEGLVNQDAVMGINTGNMTDAYALVLFEGACARTNVIYDSLNPRWAASDPSSFRAFKFPVCRPHSVLYVCANDYDGTNSSDMVANSSTEKMVTRRRSMVQQTLNADDPIGRVAIQIGRLVSSTVYDCWFDLGYSAITKPDGKLGSIRLRYSVTFKSERTRMLSYLRGNSVPIIPFYKEAYRANAMFAKRGQDVPGDYDWDVLMVYVNELKGLLRLAISLFAAVEDVLLWRTRQIPLSMAVCVGYQYLVGNPHRLPAASCLVFLVFLVFTHSLPAASVDPTDARLDSEVHARSSFFSIVGALAGRMPKPLDVKPEALDEDVSGLPQGLKKQNNKGFWTARAAKAHIGSNLVASTEKYYCEQILGDDNLGEGQESMSASAVELTTAKVKTQKEVDEFIDSGDDTVEEKIAKKRQRERMHEGQTFMGKMADRLNPVAVALGPMQIILAQVVVPLRAVRYLLFWQDRQLTAWLCLVLMALALVNMIVPWGLLLFYGARIVGAVLFGPHMHFVGRNVDAARRSWLSEVTKYHEADKEGREVIITLYKAKLMEEAKATVQKARVVQAGRSKIELERVAFLEHQPFNFLNGNMPSNANCKFVATADPSRSSAQPLVVAPVAAVVNTAVAVGSATDDTAVAVGSATVNTAVAVGSATVDGANSPGSAMAVGDLSKPTGWLATSQVIEKFEQPSIKGCGVEADAFAFADASLALISVFDLISGSELHVRTEPPPDQPPTPKVLPLPAAAHRCLLTC